MSVVGSVHDRFQFVRFGTGGDPLVVLPGMAFDNDPPSLGLARAYGWGMRRLAVGRTVTVLPRPRGVADQAGVHPDGSGLSTADIADAYASVLREEFGRVDVMAMSTGGMIGQHLALRHPELVRKLVLVVSGARLADAGRTICQNWLTLRHRQQWRALRGDLAASAVDGAVATWLARTLSGSGRDPNPIDVADFTATVTAVLRHDTTAALPDLTVSTLLLGGRDDPFFPEPALRSTAAAIPGAQVKVHPGGHGVPKQHSRWLQDEAVAFLNSPTPRS